MRYTLPPETVHDYERFGAVVLRGVLTPPEVAQLERGIEHNLAHLSPLALVASQPEDPGRFVEDFCTWQHNPDYRAITFDQLVEAYYEQVLALFGQGAFEGQYRFTATGQLLARWKP